jgi:hypothetical protein
MSVLAWPKDLCERPPDNHYSEHESQGDCEAPRKKQPSRTRLPALVFFPPHLLNRFRWGQATRSLIIGPQRGRRRIWPVHLVPGLPVVDVISQLGRSAARGWWSLVPRLVHFRQFRGFHSASMRVPRLGFLGLCSKRGYLIETRRKSEVTRREHSRNATRASLRRCPR